MCQEPWSYFLKFSLLKNKVVCKLSRFFFATLVILAFNFLEPALKHLSMLLFLFDYCNSLFAGLPLFTPYSACTKLCCLFYIFLFIHLTPMQYFVTSTGLLLNVAPILENHRRLQAVVVCLHYTSAVCINCMVCNIFI